VEGSAVDHDQRFKTLIREFFAEFLRLFFARWIGSFDFDTVEWLDKELFPDPPEGARHQVDMVARIESRERVSSLHADEGPWLALVHIEIESPDRTTSIKPRLPSYYIYLRERHGLPVLPIVIYLKVGLDGIGIDSYEERFGELAVQTFRYLYVGLPGLDAVEYLEGENWLGVALAVLMRIPKERVPWLGAEALRRLTQSSLNEQQIFLLTECVEAYLPLDDTQKAEYENLLKDKLGDEVTAVNKTSYEKGLEKGREESRQEIRTMVLHLGRKRFGNPTPETEMRIQLIDDRIKLKSLSERILDVESWDELMGAD
jgi:hypothetical protein